MLDFKPPQQENLTHTETEKVREAVRLRHAQQMAGEQTEPTVYMYDDIGYVPVPDGIGSQGIGMTDSEKAELRSRGVDHPVRTDVDNAIARAAALGFALGFNRALDQAGETGYPNDVLRFDLKRMGIEIEGEHDE